MEGPGRGKGTEVTNRLRPPAWRRLVFFSVRTGDRSGKLPDGSPLLRDPLSSDGAECPQSSPKSNAFGNQQAGGGRPGTQKGESRYNR